MPAKNTVRWYMNDNYYHVYNRGVAKNLVFKDDEDYLVFLNMLKRYLSDKPEIHPKNGPYPTYAKQVELLAFCLMPNHFHLLLLQVQDDGIKELMRALCTSYGMYFNKKYKRVGPVFQGRFKASLIHKDAYLHHISRYIHLNPGEYKDWPYSSIHYYLGRRYSEWVKPGRILELFNDNTLEYEKFVSDYEGQKKLLDELKYELAGF